MRVWWWLSRRRSQTVEQKRAREDAVAAEGNDDPEQAIARARTARDRADKHLLVVRRMNTAIRRERVTNHLADDVYQAMRRRP